MTTASNTEAHTHCWHSPNWSYTVSGSRDEVCCHCGEHRFVPLTPPPIPDGHGPHYPQPFGSPIAIPYNGKPLRIVGNDTSRCPCRIENGGSGVCGCILGSSVTFSASQP